MNTSGSSHDLIAAICHSIRIPALILIPPSATARPGDVTMSQNIQQLIIQLHLAPHLLTHENCHRNKASMHQRVKVSGAK